MIIIPRPKQIKKYHKERELAKCKLISDNERIQTFFPSLFFENGDTLVFAHIDKDLKNEQYKIIISEEKIEIFYGTLEGAYRALSTFWQIVEQMVNGKIPCMEIFDEPDFPNRGYMLDISRGKVPKLSFLKKLVDLLSHFKYNQLQLYMDAFVFEYESFPLYCKKGECLTKEEIKELKAYCEKKYMRLVPNQNGFGHMGAWTEKEELSHLAITGEDGKPSPTLNPLNEEAFSLVKRIYDDVLKTFSCDVINIGMDEPLELSLNETKEECERLGVGKVYTDYLNKVCSYIVNEQNCTPMFWDDIIFRHPEELENVPKDVIVMDWGYEAEAPFERNCRMLAERGFRFYVCPGTSMWLTFTGRSHNAMMNISLAAEVGKYHGAEGFLLTEWGDGGHGQFPSITYFPLVFGGAMSWNAGTHVCDDHFNYRKEVIEECHTYIDRYLYHVESERSLSKLVYRMGNYYLLEDSLCWNHSESVRFGYGYATETLTDETKAGFLRVAEYMEGLKQELQKISADLTVKREIAANAEMVIVTALSLCKPIDETLKARVEELKKEFLLLWNRENLEKGSEILLKRLDQLLENK